MDERFDVQGVLRDVLEVLRKHHIPVETASLNVSLLDAAFDDLIPQLKPSSATHFHRPLVIDDVPMLFRAQRRYPFDEVAQELERRIKPAVDAFADTLREENPDLSITLISERTMRSPEQPRALPQHAHQLAIHCQFLGDVHANYNQLDLAIWLRQRDATAYPQLEAWVGWLVDEESGGEWGIDVVFSAIGGIGDYAPHQLDLLQRALPSYFTSFRNEIARRRSGDPTDPS